MPVGPLTLTSGSGTFSSATATLVLSDPSNVGTITAVVDDTTIATVAPASVTGSAAPSFVVTGVGSGNTFITFDDGQGNTLQEIIFFAPVVVVPPVVVPPVIPPVVPPIVVPIASVIAYGSYNFPATFQEDSRKTSLGFDKKKIPFNWGEHVFSNTSVTARSISIKGPIGSLIKGSAGSVLATAADLEAERSLLAALQVGGPQPLFVSTSKYVLAFIESFEHKFWQDAFGHRYADWVINFYADDPRYVSPTATQASSSHTTGDNTLALSTSGSIRTYPIVAFSGSGVAPYIQVTLGGASLKVVFSQLTMNPGDTLVINCDPRPESRSQAAIYTASGQVPVNALQYTRVPDYTNNYDFTEWFPFIDPGVSPTLHFGFTTGGNFTFATLWFDRWL